MNFRLSFWSSYSLYIIGRCGILSFKMTGKENFVDFDFWLIQKMKHGDENAFDVFVRKYYKKILDYCFYHCMDKSYAEDLTQETFVKIISRKQRTVYWTNIL